MRIAQIATSSTPVRRRGADSVESMVWLLSRELTRLGHEVTTFGCRGSEVDGDFVETLPGPYARGGSPGDWQLCEWITLTRAIAESPRFDVLHSHNYLWGLPLQLLSARPMVHTLHITPYDDHATLRRSYPDACVTAISNYQWSVHRDLAPAAVVLHGIDLEQFTFSPVADGYLLYLGRFTPGKNPRAAIETARQLGMPIVLAGPRNSYFDETIAECVDQKNVRYVGPVFGDARDRLLGGARALLFPVDAPEPFGLVLVEAMACGTPVAAVDVGAVSELVEDGVTGSRVRGASDFPDAVLRAVRLDRAAVRDRCLQRFSAAAMARGYLEVYESVRSRTSEIGHHMAGS